MKYIGDLEKLDFETSQIFSNNGIDVFNAADDFFNDICHPFENPYNKDITIKLDNADFTVTSNMVLINSVSKDGFDIALEDNDFIILNTELTPELINEGIAREFVSKIQNLRKQSQSKVSLR